MTNIEEIWRSVHGYYAGIYEVSNFGRVRSSRFNRILVQAKNRMGYMTVCLCYNRIQKTVRVHRLVAHAFLPSLDGKTIINHKDLDKSNNHVSNLEWCTYSENLWHAISNGAHQPFNRDYQRGDKNKASSLKKDQVILIKRLLKQGVRPFEIANQMSIRAGTVRKIKYGETWSWLEV